MRARPTTLLALLAAVLVAAPSRVRPARASTSGVANERLAPALASITTKELEHDLLQLASPELEGRDSPSDGLARAARWIEGRFEGAGWTAFEGGFRRPFTRDLPEPEPARCKLVLEGPQAGKERTFALGSEFVPIVGCAGEVRGELVFLGFGIDSEDERFDEIDGRDLPGKVALIVEGEPRHPKRFEGPEVTAAATLWTKLAALRDNKLAGVIVARRPPPNGRKKDAAPLEPAKLAFRHTWADWVGHDMADVPKDVPPGLPPAVETTIEVASELLGEDVEALCARIDRTCQPIDRKPKGRVVALASATRSGRVPIDNVVARLEGSDERLKAEFVVIGAHYDHIGVDDRGRIGCGADDNASGTAAMLEIAQALALARPKRTVIACAFAGEEDGLLGSKAFCDSPPVPRDAIVAMINLDMVGRGETSEVAVLGIVQNPALEDVLDRARKLGRTGVKDVVVRQGEELFQRSDHFSFHKIGVPVLFFFEGLPIERNRDYHTWRDTLDLVDAEKVANTSRLVLNCLWLLADDADRPPRPRE